MSEHRKARLINEVVKRLWNEQPEAAISLKQYISETDHIKDIMQAVVKDIGYAMVDLGLRDEKDDHNMLTKDGHERLFRPRLSCTVKSLKLVGNAKDGEPGITEKSDKDEEPQMEVVLRFPAREYNDSPHSLVPGKDNVYLMMQEL
ncbi:hypothetical protein F66182_4267 [Fusarium sp. NRRL 66182]|nr:hypothetical protein F66182_4267 [Fusarium sp. NRRL 66182]